MTEQSGNRVALAALASGAISAVELVGLSAEAGRRDVSVDQVLAEQRGINADSLPDHNPTVGYEESRPGDVPATTAPLLDLGLSAERFGRRYVLGDEIGRGGVGRVQEAHDQLTGRTVAIKALHAGVQVTGQQLHRFIAEAQTTAQLEHPNVVPIYDLGTLPDGSPFFSMKRVQGRSLQQLLATREGSDLFRWLQTFSQVCMAVDYAHAKGVVHRDLKPENIMVGDFGEVLLMDWGIAKTRRTQDQPNMGLDVQITAPGAHTLDGSIVGTPGYMAPEQARDSSSVDARADVWALGAILYEILTGRRPHEAASVLATLVATASAPVVAAKVRAPDREIPDALEQICMHALELEPDDRYPSVRPLYDDIQRFLAGTEAKQRREQESEHLLSEADESAFYLGMLRDEALQLTRELNESAPLTGHEPLDEKRARWARDDRRVQIERELRLAQFWSEAKLRRAAQLVPDHAGCRRRLADIYWGRYREARARHDAEAANEHLKAVAQYDDSRYHDRMAAHVPLRLITDPPGAEVTLHYYVERDRVLTPSAPRALGATPLTSAHVPTGRVLLEINVPGRPSLALPVMAWQGDELDLDVQVPTAAALGDDFVFVPGGSFLRGNDRNAVLAAPTAHVDLTPFAIGKHPITCAEYAEFLNAIEPAQRTRRAAGLQAEFPPTEVWTFPKQDKDGDTWHPDWPVCLVGYQDAESYAAWRGQRDGAIYRLPTGDEWEKAARGTDGRVFPWGDHYDPTFCTSRGCQPKGVRPEPVGSRPIDCSPYGAYDMAGGVREWADGWFESNLRLIRGGAWNLHGFMCRAASRYGASPARGQTSIGFRLVKVIDF